MFTYSTNYVLILFPFARYERLSAITTANKTPELFQSNWFPGMKKLASVIEQFPMQELAVRRFFACDPGFREICDAHLTVACALEHWKADETKAREYHGLLDELNQEIVEFLDKQQRPPVTAPHVDAVTSHSGTVNPARRK